MAQGSTYAAIEVFSQRWPDECPKSVPVQLRWDVDIQTVDLKLAQEKTIIQGVQTIYFNNAGNANDVIVYIQSTNQRMTLQGGQQGYRPVLCGQDAVLQFTSPGAIASDVTYINLLNVPMQFGQWSA